jgi:hypothetical protein
MKMKISAIFVLLNFHTGMIALSGKIFFSKISIPDKIEFYKVRVMGKESYDICHVFPVYTMQWPELISPAIA